MRYLLLSLLLFSNIVLAAPTNPLKTTFVWIQPTESVGGDPITVTANTVYCGTTPGSYTIEYTPPIVGTTTLISNVITVDGIYYCAVTASADFGGDLLEGGYSNELGPLSVIAGEVLIDIPGVGTFGIE